MFTKKTRVISVIVTVCMLLSLMASFCLPAAAAGNYDEIVPANGLTDVSALPDIKDGLVSGQSKYKVTNLDGIIEMQILASGGESFAGKMIYLANDIDMEWYPVAPIGTMASTNPTDTNCATYYNFKGTFDGNGFVIKDLYVMGNGAYGVGLFGNASGATIKNVGIASGLIVGAGFTGSIVGLAKSGTKLINCWNAATVVGGASQAAGGLVGQMTDGASSVTNCYNLGLVYNYTNAAAGLIGRVGTSADNLTVANSYSAGTIVNGFSGLSAGSANYYGAILRAESTSSATATLSANNFYLDSIGLKGWDVASSSFSQVKDGATAVSAEELATLSSALNNELASTSEEYTVEYTDSTAGFPVLTYKVGGSVVAKRLPSADAQNVVGNDWAEQSELFAGLSANAQKSYKPASIEIKNANDLFVLGLMSSFNTMASNFGTSIVTITTDIDMNDITVIGSEYFVPIASNGTMTFTLDGQNHTIYNWKSIAYGCTSHNSMGGFICSLNGTLTNLSLENVHNVYTLAYVHASGATEGYAYPSLLVERVTRESNALILDCSTTGTLEINNRPNYNNNSGILGRVWDDSVTVKNCWSETYVTGAMAEGNTTARAIGSSNVAVNTAKYANNYWFADSTHADPTASDDKVVGANIQTRLEPSERNTEAFAVALNEASSNALWTIKTIEGEKKLVRAKDESETLVALSIQRYIPTPMGYNDEPVPYGPADVSYFIRGTEYYPTAIAGYELENGVEMPVILDEDTTINYYMIEPDYTYVNEADDLLAAHNPGLYGDETNAIFEQLQTAVDKVYDAEGTDAQIAAIYEVALYYNAAQEAMNSGDLKLEYPNLPVLSQYDRFSSMGITDWAISSKEDWIYATEMDSSLSSAIRLHLINDVDMGKTAVEPLAYGATFTGLVDGHGYSFYNFKMDMTDPNNFDATAGQKDAPVYENSFGLVAHLGNGGVIQNLGLASGTMTIRGICSQDQGVGAFVGVSESGGLIANCWNGLSINAMNKTAASPSRVGGIVGRGAGILYGCYNVGTVAGNTKYIHGLDAYASNGAGRFYNCYSLPSAAKADCSAAIGQGGGYQTAADAATKTAAPYQNTYSINNDVIYQYKKHPSTAIVEYAASHTLTWDQYNTGYMAYVMNKDRYDYSNLAPVYWTINDEGQTVHGTEANAVRKLTLMLDGEVLTEQYVNGDASFVVEYGDYQISDVVVEKGSAVVSGESMNLLTMGGTDVTISFSASCKHAGTTEYTSNNDGTHDWSCTDCGAGEEGVACSHDSTWSDNEDGTHSDACLCGYTFTENCRFRTVSAVEGETYHLRSCVCGAEKQEACEYAYEAAEEGAHRHYCTACDNGTVETCSYGAWQVVKVPTLDEEGEERSYCVCGDYESRTIPQLTGSPVTLSASPAHADETVEVTVDLNALPATGVSGFIMELEYDPEIFTFESAASEKFGAISKSVNDTAGELTLALAGDTNVTDGSAVATITFKVAKDAPAGGSVITVVSASGEYVPDGGVDSQPVALTGSIGLVDVASYAWGDTNGNKEVTIADVVYLLRVISGAQIVPDAAADVWNDTTSSFGSDGAYTLSDAVWILRYLLGECKPNA